MIGLIAIIGCTSNTDEPQINQPQNPETVDEQPEPEENPTESETEFEYETAKEDCESEGGQLIQCFTVTGYICSMPTKDGGKPCSDNSECEQECVAPPNCEFGNTNIRGACAERTHLVCDGVQGVEDGKCGAMVIT